MIQYLCFRETPFSAQAIIRPHGQEVKTLPSQGRIPSSILGGATKKRTFLKGSFFFLCLSVRFPLRWIEISLSKSSIRHLSPSPITHNNIDYNIRY